MSRIKHLTKQAGILPDSARAFSTTLYSKTLEHFPIIEKIEVKHWDFVLTVAGIFVGLSQLNHENLTDKELETLEVIITETSIDVFPDFEEACTDCREFVDRTYDLLGQQKEYQENQRFLFSDCLGGWIVWNLFGHSPNNEDERKLVRVLGAMVVGGFVTWWK